MSGGPGSAATAVLIGLAFSWAVAAPATGAPGHGRYRIGSVTDGVAGVGKSRQDETDPVRVRVAYSPALRGAPFWQSEIERALKRARDLLAEPLGRELELIETVEWPGGEHEGSLEVLLADLLATVPGADAQVVVGLAATGAYDAGRGGFFRGRRFETRGLTNYERGYAVIRLQGPIDRAGRLVAHEVAHVFGAVHVPGSGLMAADSTGTTIDPLNRHLLELHRNRSFDPSRHPLERSRWPAARKLYVEARKSVGESERGRIDLQLARLEMAEGRWRRAAELFAEVVEERPDDAVAWSKLGYARLRAGDLDAAERATRRALELRPGSYWGRVNLGVILDARGDPEAAVEQFERAIESRPDRLGAYENLGHVLASSGRHRAAAAAYRSALERAPDRLDLHRELGRAYFHLGRIEEAARQVERALSHGVAVDRRLVEEIEEALGRPLGGEGAGSATAGGNPGYGAGSTVGGPRTERSARSA